MMTNYLSCSLVEKDAYDEYLCSWSFPNMPLDLEELLLSHCEEAEEKKPFFYFRLKSDWIYILMSKGASTDIKKLFICIRSKAFNPDGFAKLLKMDSLWMS